MMTQALCFNDKGRYSGRNSLDYEIDKKDKVLDIGGGHHPFPLATHILDSEGDTFDNQRGGNKLILLPHQILMNGTTDLLCTFEDNEFDFIYTSHTLEHIEDLPRVIDEISRVGKRGFVAVPHCVYDFWCASAEAGHKWFFDYKKDTLLMRRRETTDRDEFAHQEWNNIMWKGTHPTWCAYWEGHGSFGLRFLWEIRFFWSEKIEYKIDEDIFPQIDVFRAWQREGNNAKR
jgi:SAM-dependent methyltransferase